MAKRAKPRIDTSERLGLAFEAAMELHALISRLRPLLDRVTYPDYPDEVVVLALMDRAKVVAQVAFDAGNAGEDVHHDPEALWTTMRAVPEACHGR